MPYVRKPRPETSTQTVDLASAFSQLQSLTEIASQTKAEIKTIAEQIRAAHGPGPYQLADGSVVVLTADRSGVKLRPYSPKAPVSVGG